MWAISIIILSLILFSSWIFISFPQWEPLRPSSHPVSCSGTLCLRCLPLGPETGDDSIMEGERREDAKAPHRMMAGFSFPARSWMAPLIRVDVGCYTTRNLIQQHIVVSYSWRSTWHQRTSLWNNTENAFLFLIWKVCHSHRVTPESIRGLLVYGFEDCAKVASICSSILQGDSSALRPGLGWLWFGCSTILPSCTATAAKFQSAQTELGRQWNTQNPSQPNPGLKADESPCTEMSLSISVYLSPSQSPEFDG